MATFDTSGITQLLNDMQRMTQGVGPVAEEMCMAAAEEIRKAWQKSGQEHGFIATGAMLGSVGYPDGPKRAGNTVLIDIYPQGSDARGVRNAEKAFILHYGSSRIKPSYWVDKADAEASEPVFSTLQGIWDRFIDQG